MDYFMTDIQKEMRDLARDFAQNRVKPVVKEYDIKGEVPMDLLKEAADIGFTYMWLPEKYGGLGLDHLTCAYVNEELGKADAGFAVSVGVSELGLLPVMNAGSEEQINLIADIITNGGLASFCLTEADAGSDAAALRTTATKDGDDYIINGAKCFITGGALADVYTVFATINPELGYKGICAFIVERNRPGVSIGKEEDKMGIRLSNTVEVVFDNVRIPKDHLIGKEGIGLNIALKTLNQTRAGGSASVLGCGQAALEYALEYAQVRKTFGKPIIKNQAISFMLADMEIRMQTARQMVHYCCRLADAGIVDPKLGSIAKVAASDAAVATANDAIQILGGYGYSREYPVEKLFRDARIYQIFEGTNQVQRMTISGQMIAESKK